MYRTSSPTKMHIKQFWKDLLYHSFGAVTIFFKINSWFYMIEKKYPKIFGESKSFEKYEQKTGENSDENPQKWRARWFLEENRKSDRALLCIQAIANSELFCTYEYKKRLQFHYTVLVIMIIKLCMQFNHSFQSNKIKWNKYKKTS